MVSFWHRVVITFHEFREFVRYLFSFVFNNCWHRCWLHLGTLLAYIGILFVSCFPNLVVPVPQMVFSEVPCSFWHPFDSAWVPLLAPLLVPSWFPFGSRWLVLAFLFLPFAVRHGIVMHFRIMYLD